MHFHLAALVALPVLGLASQQLGCYSEIKGISSVVQFAHQSHGYCLETCSKKNQAFAALTNGAKCACTNNAPAESAKVADDRCDLVCSGWPQAKCGGHGTWTFLNTGKDAEVDAGSDAKSSTPTTSVAVSGETAPATPTAATVGGGILVAANPSMATGMATSASAPAITRASGVAAITAASSSVSSSPSPTINAAGALRAGPAAGIALAGLGLLL